MKNQRKAQKSNKKTCRIEENLKNQRSKKNVPFLAMPRPTPYDTFSSEVLVEVLKLNIGRDSEDEI